jgi:hypothetical protein
MPTSDFHAITDVLHVIEQIKPASILEIGVGFGRWGVLCHEILDIYYERYKPADWTLQMDGIEIFENYKNPLWDSFYRQIFIGDAFELIDKMNRYDLIFAGDVIEHFEKQKGKQLIEKFLEHAECVIITSPVGFLHQDCQFGNSHEEHKSGWSEEDFKKWPHLYKRIGHTFLTVLAKNSAPLEKIKFYDPIATIGRKKVLVGIFKDLFGAKT